MGARINHAATPSFLEVGVGIVSLATLYDGMICSSYIYSEKCEYRCAMPCAISHPRPLYLHDLFTASAPLSWHSPIESTHIPVLQNRWFYS